MIFLVYICDNLELLVNGYCVLVYGVLVVIVEIYLDCELVLDLGSVFGVLEGIVGKDFVFGLDVIWI